MGIVTGNNRDLLQPVQCVDFEPIYRGRDVEYFKLAKPQAYIRFEPSQFQQCANENLYRAPEKLIYRFISKRLVFVHDTQQVLTLNSANIVTGSPMQFEVCLCSFEFCSQSVPFRDTVSVVESVTQPFGDDSNSDCLSSEVEACIVQMVDDISAQNTQEAARREMMREIDTILLRLFNMNAAQTARISQFALNESGQ